MLSTPRVTATAPCRVRCAGHAGNARSRRATVVAHAVSKGGEAPSGGERPPSCCGAGGMGRNKAPASLTTYCVHTSAKQQPPHTGRTTPPVQRACSEMAGRARARGTPREVVGGCAEGRSLSAAEPPTSRDSTYGTAAEPQRSHGGRTSPNPTAQFDRAGHEERPALRFDRPALRFDRAEQRMPE
eukprot:364935-Chlamydomonas_euryale.AAC.14